MTFEEMMDQNGSYVEQVGDEHRIITRDNQGRAIIGPVTHSRPGLLSRLRRRTRATHNDVAITTGDIPRRVPPVTHESWLARMKWEWLTRFYDEQWHKAVQHTGLDLVIWLGGGSVAAVFVKGAWWVVTL